MARVHTATASKDYPQHGIVKGQRYYYWQLYKQPKQMSLTRPKPSQLTGSSKLSSLYAAGEDFAEKLSNADDRLDISGALHDYAEAVREVAEEYRESAQNLEDAFPNGCPTMELCNDNADNLEAFADELDEAAEEIENLDLEDFDDDEDALMEDARSIADGPSCPL